MRSRDILHMCLQNLSRRKSRTFLTVLGVLIGCCAIVIMVSLGLGTQEAQDKMLAQMGDLTVIEVYNYNSDKDHQIKDDTLSSFRQIDGVAAVSPKMDIDSYYSATLAAGQNRRYQTYWSIIMGIDMASAEDMGYELIAGTLPEKSDEVLVGQYFAYNFYDSLRPQSNNMVDRYAGGWDENGNLINVPDPYFDPVGMKITLTFTLNSGATFTTDVKVTGMTKENYNTGWETSEGMIMDAGTMRSIVERIMVQDGTKKDITYNNVMVKAVDIDHVADAQAEIDAMGYNTWSMESIREPLQEESRQKMLLLGGLGAISLFVAAIGIANTMIMSISERTKEIGIMKAMGCYVRDIRAMFLMEAGCIGLLGGVLGLLFSFLVSIAINLYSFGAFGGGGITLEVLKQALLGGEGIVRVSVIKPELVIFALVFSILVGLVSGYQPANKAVKVSALEAIRNE